MNGNEPRRTRVKICGVRDVETALGAAHAGADAVGLVFWARSPRYIEPADAWAIINAAPPMLTTVALTVNASPDEYAEIEETCPTDYGQLHGEEDEETVRACGPRIIKAVRFDPDTIEERLRFWSEVEEVDAILVDGSAGGKGESLDWDALARVRGAATKPLILAGGLTSANVGEAVRLVRPWAVDVSSGVERERGVKDLGLIEAFCAAVRRADHEISGG